LIGHDSEQMSALYTTFLMDYAVTPIAAQCFGEITAFKIARQLHA